MTALIAGLAIGLLAGLAYMRIREPEETKRWRQKFWDEQKLRIQKEKELGERPPKRATPTVYIRGKK